MAVSSRKKRGRRPKVFVGSSVEGLDVAYAIQENLQHDAEVTVWPQGVFELSKPAVDSLMAQLARSDFGLFVFTPDDRMRLRKKSFRTVRDNVIFELGLFTGRLTPSHVFIVAPDDKAHLHIPTDLVGTTLGKYDPQREDGNLQAALGPFCNKVRSALRNQAKRKKAKRTRARRVRAGGAPVRDLVIHSARYGIDRSWFDVTQPLLRSLRQFGYARVGNDLAGDPKPNVVKVLRLDFSYKGSRKRVVVPEGGTLTFPSRG